MATRMALEIFDRAMQNDAMRNRLDAIANDDRWQTRYKAMNNELAEWAFKWAERAFGDYNIRVPSLNDAATVIGVASLALKHCGRRR